MGFRMRRLVRGVSFGLIWGLRGGRGGGVWVLRWRMVIHVPSFKMNFSLITTITTTTTVAR
jgi:hypothetical protein